MLYLHPIIQFLATALAVYVLYLGWPRLWAAFVGGKALFLWKRHVALGMTALIVLLVGLLGGVAVTSYYWGGMGYTGAHFWIAMGMLPLMLFGLVSGFVLDKRRGKNKRLAVIHGLANTTLAGLALIQAWTGVNVLRTFVL